MPDFQQQIITYKGRVVFIRLSMPSYSRTLKSYVEEEACLMFVNKGRASMRGAENYVNLDRNSAVLAKCHNYFFEPPDHQKRCDEEIESIGVFLY
ncbi:MAG: hypothetical protein AAF570_03645, partial [Bacteroidota bacterium]